MPYTHSHVDMTKLDQAEEWREVRLENKEAGKIARKIDGKGQEAD